MGKEKKGKVKLSSKGVPKRQNKLTWDQYEAALNGVEGEATYWGFRMVKGTIPKISWGLVRLRQTVGAAERDPHGAC